MSERIYIALDVMGGDNGPEAVIAGALQALPLDDRLAVILVGKEHWIYEHLSRQGGYDTGRVSIVNANEIITPDEHPTAAIRNKKDSSVVVGINLVRQGKAQAFVSAGSTGALLSCATITIGRLLGIERPAIATPLPSEKGFTFLIDSGANVDCKPNYLAQFGKMGYIYMKKVMGLDNPRVGLVNIGAEAEKGNELSKEAHKLLSASDINFIGNVEPRDIFTGGCDVLVCDGFVGNVILKQAEGMAGFLLKILKNELMSSPVSRLGALLSKGAYDNLRRRMDYSEIGGAPFLGLKALVVKAHGSSNARAITSAVRQCVSFIDARIVEELNNVL